MLPYINLLKPHHFHAKFNMLKGLVSSKAFTYHSSFTEMLVHFVPDQVAYGFKSSFVGIFMNP